MDRGVIVSRSIVIELLCIKLPARIGVGVVCLHRFGMVYYSTVMVVVGKTFDDLSVFIGQGCYGALVVPVVVEGAVGVGDAQLIIIV